MKNNINFFYNIITDDIHQEKNNYYFSSENRNYIFFELNREINEVNEIYNITNLLIRMGIPLHQIIPNKNNKIITLIDNKNYILMKVNIKKQEVNINDIFKMNILLNIPLLELKRNNWYELWIKKVDNIEEIINESGKKYAIINESINYYLGLAEIAIILSRLYPANENYVEHRTINSFNSYEIYNPLNIVIDNKIRDISSIIKYKIINDDNFDEINEFIFKLNDNDKIHLLIRTMFPDYYLNMVEEIISNNKKENDLNIIISKRNQMENIIIKIYNSINKIIDIEWIKKSGLPHINNT